MGSLSSIRDSVGQNGNNSGGDVLLVQKATQNEGVFARACGRRLLSKDHRCHP